ncbi:GGDEF domain-containing protein [Modestobacter sp. URMC 112]
MSTSLRRRTDGPAPAAPGDGHPELPAELADRARSSALLLTALAASVLLAWTGFDHALEPDLAPTFLAVRLASSVLMLVLLWLLAARPTGLANRRRWDAGLAAACAATGSEGEPLSVVLIDVDHFKQVNDRLGHAAGDALLRDLTALLRDRVRAGDLAARIGGDELAVLLPGADVDRAVQLAEELRAGAQLLWPQGFDRPGVSVSLGVASSTGSGSDPDALLAAADAQLYLAKGTRNAVRAPALPAG